MKSTYLIDTSAWLFVLGTKSVEDLRRRVSFLVEQNLAAMTSPILFELLSGARSTPEAVQLESYLSCLHPYPLQEWEWTEAAQWTHSIRTKAIKVKTMDALIAYKAIKHHLILIHADAGFDRLSRHSSLQTESYVSLIRSKTKQ